jgi:hypothetical protein
MLPEPPVGAVHPILFRHLSHSLLHFFPFLSFARATREGSLFVSKLALNDLQ